MHVYKLRLTFIDFFCIIKTSKTPKGDAAMARIKYVRVSTKEQNEQRQLTDANGYDKIFIDKQSGKNTARPQLQAMLEYVREGDVVEVESYSRLARNTKDLLDIIEQLDKRGVAFISQKENIDTTNPAGRLMLTIFAGLAQFEREQLLLRQAEGIAIAKENPNIRFGRPPVQLTDAFYDAVDEWRAGKIKAVEAMKKADLPKSVFYKKVKELGL